MPCVVGHTSFFAFMTELKDPYDFPKSLYLLQGVDMSLYIVAAIVIYYYTGSDVASPALGSAGQLISRIAYGTALPTVSVPCHSQKWLLLISQIIIAGVIVGHVCFKTVYMRIFSGTDRMHRRDLVAIGSWVGIALLLWILAWIISSAIPVFSNLLSLIVCRTPRLFGFMLLILFKTALFGSWFTYGLSGIFWLYMNKGLYFSSSRKIALTILNVIIVGIGACLVGSSLAHSTTLYNSFY